MKENSKHINILICAAVCLLVIVCSVFLRPVRSVAPEKTVSEWEEPAPSPPDTTRKTSVSPLKPLNYTLLLEADTLNFYLNSEKGVVLLESSPVNSSLFPAKDIDALSSGITVTTLEEGIGIIEDFTS